VAGLVYLVTAGHVHAALVERGAWTWTRLAPARDLLAPAAGLRDELADTMAVALRRLPRLDEFTRTWGRQLIPAGLLADPPDVLVLVPHGLLHQLPLHLVRADDGRALACRAGIAYSSSLALFCRTATRNHTRFTSWDTTRPAAGGGTDVLGDADTRFRRLAADVLAQFPQAAPDKVMTRPFGRVAAKRALEDFRNAVLCIVTHGFADPDQHRDSGLLVDAQDAVAYRELRLYGAKWTALDLPLRDLPDRPPIRRPAEVLTLADLELLAPTEAHLTFLVACSAGASAVLQGDEPASLAEALLRLGSGGVVAPMWDCDYDLATAWTRTFLRAWAGGKAPKALAARAAFRALGDGTDPAALGPLHLRGDWR
jgi:CHAT domain-containing protein